MTLNQSGKKSRAQYQHKTIKANYDLDDYGDEEWDDANLVDFEDWAELVVDLSMDGMLQGLPSMMQEKYGISKEQAEQLIGIKFAAIVAIQNKVHKQKLDQVQNRIAKVKAEAVKMLAN